MGTNGNIIKLTILIAKPITRSFQLEQNKRKDFHDQLRKLIIRYQITGYNINVIRQTACGESPREAPVPVPGQSVCDSSRVPSRGPLACRVEAISFLFDLIVINIVNILGHT